MALCGYCGDEFHSGGVSAVGVGTFCGHKCKVLKIRRDYGLANELHYFSCRICKAVLVTAYKSSSPERCRCTGAWLTFLYSEPVESKEDQALFARGRIWNPHAVKPQPWVCVRCGESKTGLPHVRADGYACEACYRAEEEPRQPLAPEERDARIAARDVERAAFRRAMEDRQEAAYQTKEQQR